MVLDVLKDSVKIKTGEKIIKGETVDLVVGRVEGNLSTPLPLLIGLIVNEAGIELTNAMLNQGVIIYDESILSAADSINAKIWRQRPSPKIQPTVNLGSSVDVWVTIDQLKIDDATQQNF